MRALPRLGPAEQQLMDLLWQSGSLTAEQCRRAWPGEPLKDSTVRTMLRRLEAKGYIAHEVAGRTFIYRPRAEREGVAARGVKQLMDRLLGGSAEALLVGLVRHQVVDGKELARIAQRMAQEAKTERKP